jgi:hypothetical protein
MNQQVVRPMLRLNAHAQVVKSVALLTPGHGLISQRLTSLKYSHPSFYFPPAPSPQLAGGLFS